MGKTVRTIAIGAAIVGLAFATGGVSLGPTLAASGSVAGTGLLAGVAIPTFTAVTALSTTALGSALLIAGTGQILAGLTSAAGLGAKTPSTSSAQATRTSPTIDPATARKTVYGRTAFPYDLRYYEWFGNDKEYCGHIVALASHAIESVDEIWIADELAWTSAGGVQGRFVNYFYVQAIVTEGSASNTVVVSTPNAGIWNGSHRLTGCAYAQLQYRVTGTSSAVQSPFSSGLPSKVTIIGKGAKLYDPGRDSTVPAGSGPMRVADQSTWRYITDDGATIGDNPALQALHRQLGWRIAGKLAVGLGIPAKRLNLPTYSIAARLCEEGVGISAGGTERRYRAQGVVSEGDDGNTSLGLILATCCGRLTSDGGQIGLQLLHNDLAAASTDAGLVTDDVLPGGFTWEADQKLEATPNVVRGKYTNASTNALYQLLPYPDVTVASPDDVERPLPLDIGMVESASQAQRIAKQTLARRQSGRTFSATFDARAWRYKEGDVVPLTYAPLSFNRRLFRVVQMTHTQDGTCPMMLAEEDANFYLWEANDQAPVQPASPNVYDASNNPYVLGIVDAAGTAAWSGVYDDDGGRPEDNATVGAPNGTLVGNRTAAAVAAAVGQVDDIAAFIGTIPDGATLDQRLEALEAFDPGGNLLPNSDFAGGLAGFTLVADHPDVHQLGVDNADFTLHGEHYLGLFESVPNGDYYSAVPTDWVPVAQGSWVQASAWIAAQRCGVRIGLQWGDGAGSYLSDGPTTGAITAPAGGQNLDGWSRQWVKGQVPSGARFARLTLFKGGYLETGAEYPNCWAFMLRPMLAAASAGQTVPSNYRAGGAGAGLTTTRARIEEVSTVAASATGALANRTTTVEARVGTRPNLQRNGGFENGMAGVSAPDGAAVGDDPASWRLLHHTQSGTGVVLMPLINVSPGTYTISYQVTLAAAAGNVRIDPSLWTGANATGSVSYDALSGPSHGVGTSSSTRREFTIEAPAGVNSIQLRLISYGIIAATSIDWSLIKVERGGAPATGYSSEAQGNDLSARVTVTQGAAVNAQAAADGAQGTANTALGRLTAFWQVQAVAGGDIARVAVFADNGAGGYRSGILLDASNVFITGNLLVDGTISTSKAADHSFTIIGGASNPVEYSGSGIGGGGSYYDDDSGQTITIPTSSALVCSYTLVLPAAGDVFIDVFAGQGFPSGARQWQGYIYMNGDPISSRSGGAYLDALSIGAMRLDYPAGTYTFEFRWSGQDANARVRDSVLRVFARMK